MISSLWLIMILLQMGFTSGEVDKKKECVESFEELIQVFRNKNSDYGFYNFFGKPLPIDQLPRNLHDINVFYFRMINATNETTLESTNLRNTCCQWNSEECHAYVWYRNFYWILMSPLIFHPLRNEHYLPISFCVNVPTLCNQNILSRYIANLEPQNKLWKEGIYFQYRPLWYNGKPLEPILKNIKVYAWNDMIYEKYSPSKWSCILLVNAVNIGALILTSILPMKALNKYCIRCTSAPNRRLTKLKMFGWFTYLPLMGYFTFIDVSMIHLIGTHAEYHPEYFLPDYVFSLMLNLIQLVIQLCQYPFIYSKVTKQPQHLSTSSSRFKTLFRHHAIALGWAGPIYAIQAFGRMAAYIVIYFFYSPIKTIISLGCYFLIIAVVVVILYEIYLMLRHPKNCCTCKNHAQIHISLAVIIIVAGFVYSMLVMLSFYDKISQLFDSNKLIQFGISSLCVALLGYFGKGVIKDTLQNQNSEMQIEMDSDILQA